MMMTRTKVSTHAGSTGDSREEWDVSLAGLVHVPREPALCWPRSENTLPGKALVVAVAGVGVGSPQAMKAVIWGLCSLPPAR